MRQVFKFAAYYGYMTCGNGILLGDLKMNKAVYVLTGVIALTLSSTAFAQQGGQREARRSEQRAERETRRTEKADERAAKRAERTKARFDGMDADNNGTISEDEYKASGERMFDRMDRNNDGILNDRRGRGNRDGNSRGPRT